MGCQEFPSPIPSTFGCATYSTVLWRRMWPLTSQLAIDQHQLQAQQFSMHLIDLSSIVLRCNYFARIRKVQWIRPAAGHQTVIMTFFFFLVLIWACLVAQMIKNLPATQETWVRSLNREDSSGGVNGNPLPSSCLENPMDRRSWWATVHGVTRSHTHLTD